MRAPLPYDEKETLAALSEGSTKAFALIYDYYRPMIFRSALRYLNSEELTEEIVQEVFLRIWRRRESVMSLDNFNAYIFAIARNMVFDMMKAIAEERAATAEYKLHREYSQSADQVLLDQQYQELLDDIIAQLTPQQKEVFRLSRVEGLSQEAIAKRMDISRLTVKSHMRNALQFIRVRLHYHLGTSAVVILLLDRLP